MFRRAGMIKSASFVMAAALATGCAADGTMDPNLVRFASTAGAAVVGFAGCKALTGGTDTECAIVAAIAGAAGYVISDKVLAADKAKREANIQTVLGSNEAVGYSSKYQVAETGTSGSVQLLDISTDASGRQCKQVREVYDTATNAPVSEDYKMCKQRDGTWVNA